MASLYKAILWDIDETLLDFSAAEDTGVRAVLEHFGQEPTDEKVEIYSRINDSLWKAFERGEVEKDEITRTRYQQFFDAIGIEGDGIEAEKLYRSHLSSSAIPVKGAKEILDYLDGRYDMYVVTNGVSETQRNRMKISGFGKYMKDMFVSEDAGCQKPKKEFFDYCFDRMPKISKEEIIIIGDSLSSDIKGGMNAGVKTCWFNFKNAPVPEDLPITHIIYSLEELKTIL